MDLRERRDGQVRRHPWELARLSALRRIVAGVALPPGARVLDVGCGDGFTGRELFSDRSLASLTGLDANFTDADLAALPARDPATGVELRHVRGFDEIEGESFDAVLLLDVIEHVPDDVGLLRRVRERHLAEGGIALVTVPAFPALFSAHDRFLGHERRYRYAQLRRVAAEAGLRLERGGYLFASLLLPRLLGSLRDRVLRAGRAAGLGSWRGGPALTALLTCVLDADNRLLLGLSGRGLRLPGLSAWVLCKKPPS
jgi:SAM-dependent methyltransferase